MSFNFENKDFLPGIYNYCDRWCERCRFNSRCMVYATELETRESLPDDKKNDEFEYLKVIFNNVMNMLQDFAEKEGIDLSAEPKDIENNFDEIREKVSALPLIKASLRYSNESHNWLRDYNGELTKLFENIKRSLDFDESNKTLIDELFKIKDTIEIISHYSTFIHIKLFRAHSNEFDYLSDDEQAEEDINISVKLALLGIERSIMAWEILKDIAVGFSESILPLINNLKRIKIEIEMKFPEIKNYNRPYFDE